MKKLVLPLALLLSVSAFAETVERIVAIVNTEAVLESDFKLLQERAKQRILLDDLLLPDDPTLLVKGDRHASLDYLINERILDSEVKRLNLSVTTERVDQEKREISKRNGMSLADFDQTIRNEGVSVAAYNAFLKTRIERQSLVEMEVHSKIRISDNDALTEFMKTHPGSVTQVNEFTIAHIFFNPSKKGGAAGALERAQSVAQKVQAGGNFEALAEQFSEDPNFSAGGLLGTFKAGEFLREVEAAVGSLEPGQVSGVVRSRMGFHIVKVLDKKITADPRFEKEKDRLKAKLYDQIFRRQFKIWMQSKKDDAFLRINEKTTAKK